MFLVAMSLASNVFAGPILTPTAFTVSSPDPANPTEATNNILDQSGLSATYVSGVTDFDSFVASTTASFNTQAQLGGAGPPLSYFEFDFGSSVAIDAIAVWNQWGSASLNTLNIETSAVADFSVSQLFGVFTMSIFNGANPIAADVFTFDSSMFRYLRVNNLTNAGWGSATRVNEFAFRQADAEVPVPEPTTVALLGIGLVGLAGAEVRRRRKKKAIDMS